MVVCHSFWELIVFFKNLLNCLLRRACSSKASSRRRAVPKATGSRCQFVRRVSVSDMEELLSVHGTSTAIVYCCTLVAGALLPRYPHRAFGVTLRPELSSETSLVYRFHRVLGLICRGSACVVSVYYTFFAIHTIICIRDAVEALRVSAANQGRPSHRCLVA